MFPKVCTIMIGGRACCSGAKAFLLDERGLATVDWLIVTVFSAIAAAAVVRLLMPTVQVAHTTVVNRIINITGSGY